VAGGFPADDDGNSMNGSEPRPGCDQLELITLLALGLGIVVGFVGALALADARDQALSLLLSLTSLALFTRRSRNLAAGGR
jgi:hypothetical protein